MNPCITKFNVLINILERTCQFQKTNPCFTKFSKLTQCKGMAWQFPVMNLCITQSQSSSTPGAPFTYFNGGGGGGGEGGSSDFFGLKFWPKVIFSVYERCWNFLVAKKETEGFFRVVKKALRDFFGYTNSEVGIFFQYKI